MAHTSVEFYDALEFQDDTNAITKEPLARLGMSDRHRRSESPSPESGYESDSSIDLSDDDWVTAQIDAVSISSSSDSEGDSQGLSSTPKQISRITELTASVSESQRRLLVSSVPADEPGIAPRAQSPVQRIRIDSAISGPEPPRHPRLINPIDPAFTCQRAPLRRHAGAGLTVTAYGSQLRPRMTTHSPTYMDVPELMASAAMGGKIPAGSSEHSVRSLNYGLGSATTPPPESAPPAAALSYTMAMEPQRRSRTSFHSRNPGISTDSWLANITKRQSSIRSPADVASGRAIGSPEHDQAAIRSSNITNSRPTRPSASSSAAAALGHMTGIAKDSSGLRPAAESRKSVRSKNTNTSTLHQPLTNSPQTPTRESSIPTRRSRKSRRSTQTPTRQPMILGYPTSDSVCPPAHPERPPPGPNDLPLLSISPMAVTRSQATSRARQSMGDTQNSSTHSPPRPRYFGEGLTLGEFARQAESERVRIQAYAARKAAENNPPRPHRGLRQDAIARIRAATNRRLDEQAYATRMARDAAAREAGARARVQQIQRVQADVAGTAPQMAEPTKEAIEAARILMRMQRVHIAGLQNMIHEAENRAAEQQAATEMDRAATSLLHARYGWDVRFEQERRERERARNEGNARLNHAREWRYQ